MEHPGLEGTHKDPQGIHKGSPSPPPGCPRDPFLAWELTNIHAAQLWPSHGGSLQPDNHWKRSVSSAPSWAVPGTVCTMPWAWAEVWRDGWGSLAVRAVTVQCPGTFPDLLWHTGTNRACGVTDFSLISQAVCSESCLEVVNNVWAVILKISQILWNEPWKLLRLQ